MYNKEEILKLENCILFVNFYCSSARINFNNYVVDNGKKDVDTINHIVSQAKYRIEEMRNILFGFVGINHDNYIDYSIIINYMNCLRVILDKSDLKYNRSVWDTIVDKIRKNGFSFLFAHFISKLRNIENKFDRIAKNYQDLSFESRLSFEKQMTHFAFYLQEFVMYIQLTKVIFENFSTKKILVMATASHVPSIKDSQEDRRLKLVVSN